MSLGRSLDVSLNKSEEIRFKQKNKNLMVNAAKKTHFTYEEVQSLSIIYYKLQKYDGNTKEPLRKAILQEFLHYALDMKNYRLLKFVMSEMDKRGPTISLGNWIKCMSLFLKGTLEEKIEFCFSVYIRQGVGEFICRRTMLRLMEHCFICDISGENDEEAVRDFIDVACKKMDSSRDGIISFNEYRDAVLKEPLMLECLGQVLPSRLAAYGFRLSFTKNCGKV